jgi:hypothetical protein
MEPKLTPALRKMPLTDLRHTIGTGDLFHKQTNIYQVFHDIRQKMSEERNNLFAHFY